MRLALELEAQQDDDRRATLELMDWVRIVGAAALLVVGVLLLLVLTFVLAPEARPEELGVGVVKAVKVKPEAPKAKAGSERAWLWGGLGALAGAKAADAWRTRQLQDRGGIELNPIYGRHPSVGRQVGVNVAFMAIEGGGYWLTQRNHHAWVRWTGRVMLGYSIANHAKLAGCNASLPAQGNQRCSSLPGMAW